MLFNNFMNIIYILLYIAPFSVIRYYPFKYKLRVSVKTLIIIYATLLGIQSVLFCFISVQPYWNVTLTQIYRMVFVAFYALLSFTMVKEKLSRQFYVWSLTFVYAGFVMANSNFIEARFFKDFARSFPHTVANLVSVLQIFTYFPFAIKFTGKWLVPAINSMENKIWYIVGLIPILLYSIALFSTASLEFDKISTVGRKSVS